MNTKGFTLVELLTVIMILAILAIVAIPIVQGILDESRNNVQLIGAQIYTDAIDLAISNAELDMMAVKNGTYNIMSDGNICLDDYNNYLCKGDKLIVDVSKDYPDEGIVEIENGKVKDVVLKYNGKTNDKTIVKDETGNLIYLPPPKSFAEDSWYTIAANINSDVYKVGDTKEVTLTGYTNLEKDANGDNIVTYTVRIANLPSKTDKYEEKCGTDGFSETACGFVVEFVDIITKHKMNDTATNVGGWEASLMRKFVTPVKDEDGNVIEGTGTIYNALPEDLKNNIIETKVVSGHESGKTTNYETQDKLYLLLKKELYGAAHTYDTVVNETRQLDYYIQNGVTTESSKRAPAIKKYNGTATKYWLRSASSYSSTNGFFTVNTTGVLAVNSSDAAYGVAVAFRIG